MIISLFDFLRRLEQAKIFFKLERIRDQTIMVHVVVPGQRWEVEFFEDGEVEIEIFRSNGVVDETDNVLQSLFDDFGEMLA